MRYSAAILPVIVLMGLLCGGPRAYPSPGNDQIRAVLTLLTQLESSYAGTEDYAAVFQKQERVDGELLPEETILLKFQKPLKVYMKWIKGPHRGKGGPICGRRKRQQSDRARGRLSQVCNPVIGPERSGCHGRQPASDHRGWFRSYTRRAA